MVSVGSANPSMLVRHFDLSGGIGFQIVREWRHRRSRQGQFDTVVQGDSEAGRLLRLGRAPQMSGPGSMRVRPEIRCVRRARGCRSGPAHGGRGRRMQTARGRASGLRHGPATAARPSTGRWPGDPPTASVCAPGRLARSPRAGVPRGTPGVPWPWDSFRRLPWMRRSRGGAGGRPAIAGTAYAPGPGKPRGCLRERLRGVRAGWRALLGSKRYQFRNLSNTSRFKTAVTM